MNKQLRVPVGATPRSPYKTWAEHRAALHEEADGRRARILAARRI